jgi:coenzyme F420-reducing hydrogenase delta subunit
MIKDLEEVLKEFEIQEKDIDVSHYSAPEQNLVVNYLKKFGPKEKKAFAIAKQHLGTSFHILKSTGYNEWKKNTV